MSSDAKRQHVCVCVDACVCLASVYVDDVCWPVLQRFGGVVHVLKALAAV